MHSGTVHTMMNDGRKNILALQGRYRKMASSKSCDSDSESDALSLGVSRVPSLST